MHDDALYVYGIVSFGSGFIWKGAGIDQKDVYTLREGECSALVHECKEMPYTSEDPEKIKEQILTHNVILEKAMEKCGGVIPLPFNTIIKKGNMTSKYNLRAWLMNEHERLQSIFNRIKGKKEYGIRVYYDNDKLPQEFSDHPDIQTMRKKKEGKSTGMSYLVQQQMKIKEKELYHSKINDFRQKLWWEIKKITPELTLSPFRITLQEEKDLLWSMSILADKEKMIMVKQLLDEKVVDSFSYQIVGPFAPYSFVNDEVY